MAGYTKLFSSITDSTIWQAPDATRLVWITMLAMADQNGVVEASVPGLSDRARVSLEACVEALRLLSEPDEWSRTKTYDGRRITDTDGGWVLLNHGKYRAIRDAEERREQARLAMAKLRSDRKDVLTVSNVSNVSNVSHGLPQLAQAEAEASTKARAKQKQPQAALPACPEWIDPEAWTGFIAMRTKERHPLTPRAATLILKSLAKLQAEGQDPNAVLDQSTRNGWRDVFAIKPNGASHVRPEKETYAARLSRKYLAEQQSYRDSDRAIGQDDDGCMGEDVGVLLGKVVKQMR